MDKQVKHKNIIKYIIIGVLLFLLIGGGVFGFLQYNKYKIQKQIKQINSILQEDLSIYNCKKILDFDKNISSKDNKLFDKKLFDNYKADCLNKYDISNLEINLENCKDLIASTKTDFFNNYILTEKYNKKREECISKFLTVKFSTGTFFDIEQDFKSKIYIDFSIPFYKDKGEVNSDEFINNRIEAKKRLVDLLEIEPKVSFDYKDIVLYPERATLNLSLSSLTKYSISIKSFNSGIGTEKVKKQIFDFTTPENKFFGFKILDKVSLYKDDMPPRFELLKYNSEKEKAKIKICRIDNESYAKIEVFREARGLIKEKKEFFKNQIDNLKTYDCKEKEIVFDKDIVEDSETSSEGQSNKKIKLIKKEFNFDDLIGNPSRSGLYYVTFVDKEDREFNNRVQPVIFFGIIDSHITMKTSRNGEVFFFVNDFSGKPLKDQEIRVYINEFVGKDSNRDQNLRKYNNKYFSPLDKNVLSKPIMLGKTNNKGILKINLSDKIKDVFYKTFDFGDYYRDGNYDSLFITSASDDNLTYVSSKWNGGISPWNFGYTVGSYWWGDNINENADNILLNTRGEVEKELYTHIYTDRKLYLPGEKVNIKFIARNSMDLSVPKGKKVNIKIFDSKGKEILNKEETIGDFGSFYESIILSKDTAIGNYYIKVTYNDKEIGNSGFSVEVFKNPKFKNDIILKTDGLNGELVNIDKTEKGKYYRQTKYKGRFKIKASILSKYYSGQALKNVSFTYKVYKQYYYDDNYWDDCFYGCYWEPQKEFYTGGKGVLDEYGRGIFDIDIEFDSSYEDYKYIVEVTVKDSAGDIISGSNSIIAKLPYEYKKWNPKSGIHFSSDKRFYKVGEDIKITGSLTQGEWNDNFNNKYVLIIKKKDYETKILDDVRGYKRPITRSTEKLEKILKVNKDNFNITEDGKISLNYKVKETGEYIFEFGILNIDKLDYEDFKIDDFINEFSKNKKSKIEKEFKKKLIINYDNVDFLIEHCIGSYSSCDSVKIYDNIGCVNGWIDKTCMSKEKDITIKQSIKLSDLIRSDSRKYFSIISYGDTNANNPIKSDNKIRVLSEKISYSLGDTARIMVRLPYKNAKILLTIEKAGVVKSEYINVKGNIFFKEIKIDDTFIPNAYVGVVAVDTRKNIIPEYKVGYTEIVVDKSDKKAFLNVTTNKDEYKPREEVVLNIENKDKKGIGRKSELTVMVVDDSLISLMGNVDLNILEKMYKKLPFQIQTSITNIAMLKNYYFSRPGIVGGSGFGSFKGGDSAVSSRNIFKNTAYYNPSVITDSNGKVSVKFNLPDNLTNFRIMVISNSKDNYFGYSQTFIKVRKDILIEDKTPKILRIGDNIILGANIFNNTDKEIGFKIKFESDELDIKNSEKNIILGANSNKFVSWKIINNKDVKEIKYKISVLGDTKEHSDKIEGIIEVRKSPVIISNIIKSGYINGGEVFETGILVPENTDLEKTKIEVIFSNYRLNGISKIVKSLAIYPYGCIEQTTSSTYPNAILLKYNKLFSGIVKNKKQVENNLKVGIERIKSMQTKEGGFAYWQGSNKSDLHITPFVLRRLIDMKDSGVKIDQSIISNAIKYLEENINNMQEDTLIAESFLAFVKVGKGQYAYDNLIKGKNTENFGRHALIAYTYGLVLFNKNKYKEQINLNIEKIKNILDKKQSNYRYWNKLSDKAIFLSMLIDYNYSDKKYIDIVINELYNRDWSSYYYSTQAKNNAFITFFKYIKENKGRYNKFGFSLGTAMNREKLFRLGHGAPNIVKKEYILKNIVYDNKIDFKVANIDGTPMSIDLIMKKYPKDVNLVKSYSNKIKVSREIYEIKDEFKFDKCMEKINFDKWNNLYSDENNVDGCKNILIKQISDNYKKGGLYKININVEVEDDFDKRNLVVEDYLPAGFNVINSKFNTNSVILKQNSSKDNRRIHTEIKPNVVFYNIDYLYNKQVELTYFIRADFAGDFTYPPVSAYMMYNPIIRANSNFRKIRIK